MAESWFRERLKSLGRTQKGMSQATGIPEWALSRIINGERKLGADEAVRIAAFLDADVPTVAHHARPRKPAAPEAA